MPHNQPEKESFPRSEAASPSFEHFILEGETFGIVVFQPGFRGVGAGKDLEVIGVSDLLAFVNGGRRPRHTNLQQGISFPVPLINVQKWRRASELPCAAGEAPSNAKANGASGDLRFAVVP